MATIESMTTDFRALVADDDPNKNILNGKTMQYTDAQIAFFIRQALKDVNSESPRTNFTVDNFPDDDLLVEGAIIFAMMAEGILQLRNQLDYNDAGLAISMFNKTAGYQGWAAFLLQTYMSGKLQFKRSILASSPGAGFVGIRSQFSPYWGNY